MHIPAKALHGAWFHLAADYTTAPVWLAITRMLAAEADVVQAAPWMHIIQASGVLQGGLHVFPQVLLAAKNACDCASQAVTYSLASAAFAVRDGAIACAALMLLACCARSPLSNPLCPPGLFATAKHGMNCSGCYMLPLQASALPSSNLY